MRILDFGEQIDLETHVDGSGQLTVIEPSVAVGIAMKRIYFLHGIKEGARRGGHAHRELHQLVVAVSGSFDLHLTRGGQSKVLRASSPRVGFYVPPMTWRELDNFSPRAVCLVIASEHFLESDYIRDRTEFEEHEGAKRG